MNIAAEDRLNARRAHYRLRMGHMNPAYLDWLAARRARPISWIEKLKKGGKQLCMKIMMDM